MTLKISFEIKQNSRGCVIVRTGGEYSQHAHIKTLDGCVTLIRLIDKNKLPNNRYLQGSCKRLLTSEEYEQLKPCKQMYYNVNRGVRA